MGVLSLIRDEMYERGYSDVEVDFELTELDVNAITKPEAEEIGITCPHTGDISSLWHRFVSNKRECVVACSLDNAVSNFGGVEELNFDDD